MLASLENVRTFLRENAAEIGETLTDSTQKMLDDSIAELGVHVATQNTRHRVAAGALARQRTKRESLLRDHMAPIARIAGLQLRDVPELVSLTLPKKRASLQQLVALAEGMAGAATPHADVFITAGRKHSFIDELKTTAGEMQAAAYDRAQHRFNVKMATAEVAAKLSRGRKVVRMIDAFMQSTLVGRPGLLEAWNMAKRVPNRRAAVAAPSAEPAAAVTDVVTAA